MYERGRSKKKVELNNMFIRVTTVFPWLHFHSLKFLSSHEKKTKNKKIPLYYDMGFCLACISHRGKPTRNLHLIILPH